MAPRQAGPLNPGAENARPAEWSRHWRQVRERPGPRRPPFGARCAPALRSEKIESRFCHLLLLWDACGGRPKRFPRDFFPFLSPNGAGWNPFPREGVPFVSPMALSGCPGPGSKPEDVRHLLETKSRSCHRSGVGAGRRVAPPDPVLVTDYGFVGALLILGGFRMGGAEGIALFPGTGRTLPRPARPVLVAYRGVA
jgi:hypothetical protein